MSDDAAMTTDPPDTSDVGERRRAIQAERERRAQRDRQDELPPVPSTSLVRPYARMASPTGSLPTTAAGEEGDPAPEEVAAVDEDVDERADEPVVEPTGGQNDQLSAGAPDVPMAQEAVRTPASWPEPAERLRAPSAGLWTSGSGPASRAVEPEPPAARPEPPVAQPPAPEPKRSAAEPDRPAAEPKQPAAEPEPPAARPVGRSLSTPAVPPSPPAYEVEPHPSVFASPWQRPSDEPAEPQERSESPELPPDDVRRSEAAPVTEPPRRAGVDEWAALSLRVGDDDAWLRALRESLVVTGGAADDLGPDPDERAVPEPVAPSPWDDPDADARDAEAVTGGAAREHAAVEQAAVEQTAREQEAREREAREQEAREREAGEQGAHEQAASEQAAHEQAAYEQAAPDEVVVQDETPADRARGDSLIAAETLREEVIPNEPVARDNAPLIPTHPPFRRPPTERLTRALTDDPAAGPADRSGDKADEGQEALRGTLEPVLRRSTKRAKVVPVIRPPVLPPEPGDDGLAEVRVAPASWDEAMAANVVPSRNRRGPRPARARHESAGAEEYHPRPGADRSLTLLVLGMLLVLAVLVGVAVWAFWPRAVGGRSMPPVTVTAQLGAPSA